MTGETFHITPQPYKCTFHRKKHWMVVTICLKNGHIQKQSMYTAPSVKILLENQSLATAQLIKYY